MTNNLIYLLTDTKKRNGQRKVLFIITQLRILKALVIVERGESWKEEYEEVCFHNNVVENF